MVLPGVCGLWRNPPFPSVLAVLLCTCMRPVWSGFDPCTPLVVVWCGVDRFDPCTPLVVPSLCFTEEPSSSRGQCPHTLYTHGMDNNGSSFFYSKLCIWYLLVCDTWKKISKRVFFLFFLSVLGLMLTFFPPVSPLFSFYFALWSGHACHNRQMLTCL